MVINDAIILGFNRTRQYFEGDIFAKGDLVSISVEGTILDVSNDGGSISNTIAASLSGIYEGSISTSNYNRSLGLIEGGSHKVGGIGLEADRLNAGLGTDEIIINGTNYGRGRVVNISSMTGPELTQSMTMAERFSIDLEIIEDIGAVNFTIAGSGTIDSGYAGLEATLEPYAARLEIFQETFNFQYGENGGLDYEHNLNIKYRDIPGDPLAIDIAKDIATDVFNSRPYFGELDPDFEATNDPNQVITIPAMYPDTRIHNAYYTETYDQIGQTCNFSKKWSRYKDINTITSASSPNSIYGAGTSFGTSYTCNKSHQSTWGNGFSTVTENGDLRALSKHAMGAVFIGKESGEAYGRCNTLRRGLPLFEVPVESTSYQDPVGNKFGYRISYTNDPSYFAGPTGPNNFGSMSVSRDYSVSQAEDGVIEIGSNHVAKPHKRRELYSDEEVTKTLDILREGHDSSVFFPGYKNSAGGTLQTTTESYNFGTHGGEISISMSETDDQQIFLNNGDSAFSKKSVSVNVDHPVAEKETYLIAGCGEVIHVSPQSSLGTIEISFEGTVKRDMKKHALTLGTLETEAVDANGGVTDFEFKDILDEAYEECSRYFVSRVLVPSQVFITDTSYSFQGDRGFNMTITLNYSKDAYISDLETRR